MLMPDLSAFRFSKTHEWVTTSGDTATVGVSEHAQQELGDVIFVEFPDIGTHLDAGQRFGVIESVKAASDLYSPIAGTVTAINEIVATNPEKVNQDPYGDGWLIKLSGIDAGSSELVDAAAYAELTKG